MKYKFVNINSVDVLIFCPSLYINMWVKEHDRNIRYKQLEKSAIVTHCWTHHHNNKKRAELLKTTYRPTEVTN